MDYCTDLTDLADLTPLGSCLVHHVGMAIVHPSSQEGVGALQNRSKGGLSPCCKVPQGTHVACDVLSKSHNLGLQARPSSAPKLPEGTGKQQHLLKVGSLICIDDLYDGPPGEWQGMVLVVALSVSKHGKTGELNPQARLSPATQHLAR